jgi:transposase
MASRPPSERGFVPLAQRWVVEQTFSWLNYYRSLVHGYDFTTAAHQTGLPLANYTLYINRLAPPKLKS